MRYYLRSEIAKIANIHPETLRFYENNQLLPLPERASNGYRQYPEDILLRLEIIQMAKSSGFTLKEIKQLLQSAKSIADISDAVNAKIIEIEHNIKTMQELKKTLESFNKEIETKICPNIQAFLPNET